MIFETYSAIIKRPYALCDMFPGQYQLRSYFDRVRWILFEKRSEIINIRRMT
jgi:hypothetical protein